MSRNRRTGAKAIREFPRSRTRAALNGSQPSWASERNPGASRLSFNPQTSDRAKRSAVAAEVLAPVYQTTSAWPWRCCTSRCVAKLYFGVIHRARGSTQSVGAGHVLDAESAADNHVQDIKWCECGMQDVGTGRHVACDLHAHLVFITKYRRRVLSALAIEDPAAILAKVCGDFGGQLKAHFDLLVIFAISTLVSSRLLRERRPETSGRCKDGVLRSPSYLSVWRRRAIEDCRI
jgi:putative transposase